MAEAFFESQNLPDFKDYDIHICLDPVSLTRIYLILDLHCKETPSVDLSKLEIQVYKVSKNNKLCVDILRCEIELSQTCSACLQILESMLAS
jgi:hypothetical protein